MDVTPLIRSDQQVIQSYSNGRFRVSGHSYESAIFVSPEKTEIWNLSKNINELEADDFAPLFAVANEIDVVLLGCGAESVFIPPSFRQALKDKGLIIEVMDTGAACRTYNVLMAEGRRVVAAMLPAV
jgi:uncharacterized protein